jgi:hypothetical protein
MFSGRPFFIKKVLAIVTVTIPSKDILLVFCDAVGCKERVELFTGGVDELPLPWRKVSVPGWSGDFHACSDKCEGVIVVLKGRSCNEG